MGSLRDKKNKTVTVKPTVALNSNTLFTGPYSFPKYLYISKFFLTNLLCKQIHNVSIFSLSIKLILLAIEDHVKNKIFFMYSPSSVKQIKT